MRKIISGRTYNTDTSKHVGEWDNAYSRRDFNFCEEDLYKNTRGAYFVYGQGGPMSKYAVSAGQNSWSGGSDLVPLTAEEARAWAEEKLSPANYEAEFGEVEEAECDLATRERVNMSLDSIIMHNLRRLSAQTAVPVSRMVDKAIMAMYGQDFKEAE